MTLANVSRASRSLPFVDTHISSSVSHDGGSLGHMRRVETVRDVFGTRMSQLSVRHTVICLSRMPSS